jgi:hypothetical protein
MLFRYVQVPIDQGDLMAIDSQVIVVLMHF